MTKRATLLFFDPAAGIVAGGAIAQLSTFTRRNIVDDGAKASRPTFPAELQGKTIRCDTLADAIIIRFAEHALTSPGKSPYDARTLLKIAEIVESYGAADAAERLKRIDS